MKKLDRRVVLRGIGGIALGLPWLEAMGQNRLNQKNIRLGFIQFPNGVIPELWTPKEAGKLKLSKTLAPLEPVVKKVNVHTGLGHNAYCNHIPGIANL
ncbi:MAG: DUF1552 domain-containing protein, partial [Lentisphaeraceae bacterium]|nr:DUF1552 domain-containing protein [Lentisphaeraceae bacterium]